MSKAIPKPVTDLIDAFSRLPGVGPKTASRLTYYLLRAPDDLSQALATAISDLKTKTRYCSVCYNITEQEEDLANAVARLADYREALKKAAAQETDTVSSGNFGS